jgi:nicotinate-nucleotide--dimethylbenzimidazole phosphoribosyltransferase
MTDFHNLNLQIPEPDEKAIMAARARWNAIAKPLGSLGLLEDVVIRIAGIQQNADVDISRRAVIVMCADNGVVRKGVTQTGQEVTAIVTENLARGDTSVCRMARMARAEVVPVDVGVARHVDIPEIGQRNIRRGTADMTEGPAMTRNEAALAVETGIERVRLVREQGVRLVATGEMGIGNTTTSSAVTAVLTARPIEEVTGRGAGLSDEGLLRKFNAIQQAISVNAPDASDALDVLHKIGGLDIAGLAGVCIGGALHRVPVLLDGFISLASALVATRLCPRCAPYLLASHISKEPAARILLDELKLKPLICAEMCLGEGTGAVAALPLIDMALAVYREMATFEDISVEAYKPLC